MKRFIIPDVEGETIVDNLVTTGQNNLLFEVDTDHYDCINVFLFDENLNIPLTYFSLAYPQAKEVVEKMQKLIEEMDKN